MMDRLREPVILSLLRFPAQERCISSCLALGNVPGTITHSARGYSGLREVRDHPQATESSMGWRNDGVLAWHGVCVLKRGQEREGEVTHGNGHGHIYHP